MWSPWLFRFPPERRPFSRNYDFSSGSLEDPEISVGLPFIVPTSLEGLLYAGRLSSGLCDVVCIAGSSDADGKLYRVVGGWVVEDGVSAGLDGASLGLNGVTAGLSGMVDIRCTSLLTSLLASEVILRLVI